MCIWSSRDAPALEHPPASCDFSQEKVQYSNEHGRFKSKFEYKPSETDVHAEKLQPKSTPTNEYKTDLRQNLFSLESEFHALENSSFQRTKIIELSKNLLKDGGGFRKSVIFQNAYRKSSF